MSNRLARKEERRGHVEVLGASSCCWELMASTLLRSLDLRTKAFRFSGSSLLLIVPRLQAQLSFQSRSLTLHSTLLFSTRPTQDRISRNSRWIIRPEYWMVEINSSICNVTERTLARNLLRSA